MEEEPEIIGFINSGNTCFMNTALQILLNLPDLVKYFLSDNYKECINLANKFGFQGKVADLFALLITELSQANYKIYKLSEFKHHFSEITNNFFGSEEQDTYEFMTCLIDSLHEDLKNEECSIITQLFQGTLQSKLTCLNCKTDTSKLENYFSLSLPLLNPQNQIFYLFLEDSIEPKEFFPENSFTIKEVLFMIKNEYPINGQLMCVQLINGKIKSVDENEYVGSIGNTVCIYEYNSVVDVNNNTLDTVNRNVGEDKIVESNISCCIKEESVNLEDKQTQVLEDKQTQVLEDLFNVSAVKDDIINENETSTAILESKTIISMPESKNNISVIKTPISALQNDTSLIKNDTRGISIPEIKTPISALQNETSLIKNDTRGISIPAIKTPISALQNETSLIKNDTRRISIPEIKTPIPTFFEDIINQLETHPYVWIRILTADYILVKTFYKFIYLIKTTNLYSTIQEITQSVFSFKIDFKAKLNLQKTIPVLTITPIKNINLNFQPKDRNINFFLDLFCKREYLMKNDQFYCQVCRKKCDFTKQLCLVTLPKYLIVHFKRLVYETKNVSKVVVDDVLFINGVKYEISSIGCHYELDRNSGHYLAYVKKGGWYLVNDANVEKVDVIDRDSMCVVVYVKSE